MLDQAEFIARYDKENALGVIADQPRQLHQEYEPGNLSHLAHARQVVVAGMGGSALAAEFVKSWLADRLPVPLVIVRDYTLPAFVGPDTLVVASSYSGNTEETLAALAEAETRGAKIAVMAAGGKLLEAARAKGHAHIRTVPHGHPHFDLPAGLQPRLAVLYGVKALAVLLESVGLVSEVQAELSAAAAWVLAEVPAWAAEVPAADNPAKQIAQQLAGHPVVVYGGPTLALPAMKWKIDCNENAKNLAFYNYFPEFNHNEFLGWAHPVEQPFKVVELRSHLDHPQVQKRFDITNKLRAKQFVPIEIQAAGTTKLEQMLWTVILGDFASAYLAFLNGIDPTPVELIERFKHELA
ncbi:MAG TPA: bifunctional phosphoglucose/phosphomannose isomerase [Candidatus Saccharimonadia bacterium]|nr:bifunctional phosphoglucose/phosphomannose isomerase [Candidatus Saccharimonadia bacterium]